MLNQDANITIGRPARGVDGPMRRPPVLIELPQDARSPQDAFLLPYGKLAFDARYERDGADLVLSGRQGLRVVIRGYFGDAGSPAIATEGGGRIEPGLVAALANSRTTSQPLRAIGTITRSRGRVIMARADGTRLKARADMTLCEGDLIETGPDGGALLAFTDGTMIRLGHDGRLMIDDYSFEPTRQRARFGATLVTGSIVFTSGETAAGEPGAAVLRTSLATITLRDRGVCGAAASDGEADRVLLLPSEPARRGKIVVGTRAGFVSLSRVNQATIVSDAFLEPADPFLFAAAEAARFLVDPEASIAPSARPLRPTAPATDMLRAPRRAPAPSRV